MSYETKLNAFTEGKRFHSAIDSETGQAYRQFHTGDKTLGCVACGSKRAYLLFAIEDEAGNRYWVGYECQRHIMWQQEQAEAKALARLSVLKPQEMR